MKNNEEKAPNAGGSKKKVSLKKKEEEVPPGLKKWGKTVMQKGGTLVNEYFTQRRESEGLYVVGGKVVGKADKLSEFVKRNVLDLDGISFFDNETGEDPSEGIRKLEHVELFTTNKNEKNIPQTQMSIEDRTLPFLIITGVNLYAAIMLPFVTFHNGGTLFLIPFTLSTIFITLPIMCFQQFWGQFTSLPSVLLFHRMAPIFTGIGAVTIFVQYITYGSTRTEHRFVSFLTEVVYRSMTPSMFLTKTSLVLGTLNGMTNHCNRDNYFSYNGECLHYDDAGNTLGHTARSHMHQKISSLLQSTPDIVKFSAAAVQAPAVIDPYFKFSHYMSSTLVVVLICFHFSARGLSSFTGRIPTMTFYGFLLTTSYLLISEIYQETVTFRLVLDVIGSDPDKLYDINTWAIALVQSFLVFSISDGTFWNLGMVSKFQTNFLKHAFRQIIASLGVVFLIFITYSIVVVRGVQMYNYKMTKKALTADEIRTKIFNEEDVMLSIYRYFFRGTDEAWPIYPFAIFFVFWQACSQIVFAQTAIVTAYRWMGSFFRMPKYLIQYLVLIVHFSLVTTIHIAFAKSEYNGAFLGPYSVFFQMLTLPLFGRRRFFTCFYTIFKDSKYTVHAYKNHIIFVYNYFLPLCLFLYMACDFLYGSFTSIILSSFIVVLFGYHQYYYFQLIKKPKAAWLPTEKWGPTQKLDRLAHRNQQRATCPDLFEM